MIAQSPISSVWCEAHDDPSGACVLEIEGDLDHRGAIEIENEVRWAVAHATRGIRFDCSRLNFVDSTGLRLLIEAECMAANRHIEFGIVNPSPSLQTLLQIAGLEDLLV